MNKLKEKPIKTNFVTKIDMTTGEVTQYTEDVYENKPKIKEKSLEKLKRDSLMHEFIGKEIGRFFFYFYNNMDKIEIPLAYKTRFIYLSSFLSYNEEQLVCKENGKGNVYFRIKRDKMFEILNLSEAEFKRTISSLTKSKVMYKDGKYYNISAKYSIYGENKNTNENYTRVFTDNIRKLYNQTLPKNHKQLYYLFKLLPYINKQSNIICSNIDECQIKNVKPLTQKEIMKILELDVSNSSKWLKSMMKFKIDNNFVIMKTVINKDITCIIINPKVYYGGCNIDNLQYVIGLFDMAKELETN